MRTIWHLFALVALANVGQACGQASASPAQKTPPAILVRLSASKAEILYHDRNDRMIVLDFLVTDATQRAKVKERDTVLVSYVDRGRTHIAQSIDPYLPFEKHGATSRPSGGVAIAAPPAIGEPPVGGSGDVAENALPTGYSREGAEALKAEVLSLFTDNPRSAAGPSAASSAPVFMAFKEKGFTVAPAVGGCKDVVAWESGEFRQINCGPALPTTGMMHSHVGGNDSYGVLTLRKGDLVRLGGVSIEPDGLRLSVLYRANQNNYSSVLKIPFSEGELPTQADLQKDLREVIEVVPQGSELEARRPSPMAPAAAATPPAAPAAASPPNQ